MISTPLKSSGELSTKAISGLEPQDDILRLLATSEGDVLEDDTLVDKVQGHLQIDYMMTPYILTYA